MSYKAFSALYEDLDSDASQPGETLNVMPTLSGVASSVAKLDGTQMDKKQYIAYKIIGCTFLLGLVYEGRDDDSKLRKCLQQTLANGDPNSKMETLVKELKIRGRQDQLLIFLTGPAGTGKSTLVMIARQFCFECCRIVGVLWNDWTFFLTAYTGTTAMSIGGYTICKSAFLCTNRVLTEDDKRS